MEERDSIYDFQITSEHAGERIDRVLSLLMEDVSRSYIQKLIEDGRVSVDGKPMLSKKQKLEVGSTVLISVPQAVPCEAAPEDIDLDIVYEDEDIIVVNKPRGMVVHPAAGNLSGTLVNGLLHHCGSMSVLNGLDRPGIVHRIDKDTTGLLVAAKSTQAHMVLSEMVAAHRITRIYNALVYGNFKEPEGTVDAPLGRDPGNRLKMAIVPGGKRAVTHYKVLEEYKGFSELQCMLETGRTHQIRVHLTSIGHPLVGDPVYGSSANTARARGQMLHARTLIFEHPVSHQYMEFNAPLPEDYLQTREKLRRR